MEKIKFSTVIPVYNAEKFLERCIDSVIGQDLEMSEIICIDDGSTDSSQKIIETYCKTNKNIQYIKQKNQYAGTARNKGLHVARGNFVHFLDADDCLLPNVYKELYDFAVSLDADCIKFRSKCFSMKTGVEKSNEHKDYTCEFMKATDFEKLISIEDHPTELIEASSHTPWSGIYKRSFLIDYKIEFNRLRCVNDRSFYIKVITNTQKIAYLDKYVVNHQIENPDSLIGIRGDNFECQFSSFNMIRDYLRGIKSSIKNDIYKRILTMELTDLLIWYVYLSDIQKIRIREKLKDFFAELDWDEINKNEDLYSTIKKINILD